MKEQIEKLLRYYQLSASEFAKNVGVNASGLSHIIKGNRNNLSIETILKIFDVYPSISLEWLILGKGNMLKDNVDMPEKVAKNEDISVEKTQVKAIENQVQDITPPPDLLQLNLMNRKPEKKVEKIMVFYSDKSFDEFYGKD